jgi:RHS repeat-associated protein
MMAGNVFETAIQAGLGTNTFTVQATDTSGNTSSKSYEVEVTAAGASYTYDPSGNLTAKTEGADSWTYTWNAENQLTKVEKNGSEIARIAYDPLGRRVERVGGGVTARFTHDGMDVVREVRGTSILKYVHGLGIDVPLAREDGTGVLTYYHADGLGSIFRQTSQAGAVVHEYRYDTWGNIDTGRSEPGYAFTGREWDPETALYYYRARYYDPSIGRFISEDPIGLAGGLNLYAYVGNDPTNEFDPDGLKPICIYNIPLGRMECWDDGGRRHDSSGWVSGLGGPCQNNPTAQCCALEDSGPIPPGGYTSKGKPPWRPPSTTRRMLEPDASNTMYNRSGFQTHACPNVQTCSTGCLAQPDQSTMDDFNDFVDQNSNTRVQALGYLGPTGPGYGGALLCKLRQLLRF